MLKIKEKENLQVAKTFNENLKYICYKVFLEDEAKGKAAENPNPNAFDYLMNRQQILKPLEVRNKKQELHNFLLNNIKENDSILKSGFSQEDGTKRLQKLANALCYLGRRKHIINNAVETNRTSMQKSQTLQHRCRMQQ